jgi:hypothetical protein
MKPFLSLVVIAGSIVGLCIASYDPAPKATASPAPIIDHSAELAALQAENADLKESLRVAQSAIHAAPLAVIAPGGGGKLQTIARENFEDSDAPAVQRVAVSNAAGVRPQPAAYVAAFRPVQSCSGGVCMPAAQGPRYQYQSRSSQPRRLFSGRLFGRR